MSPNPELSAPGSSTYSSNTLHVGDGTWDSGRDTFLLPNLMGLNFDTMRYNGMGNRFRDMPNYQTMICAHAILATIAFLGLVPISLLIIRYYSRWNPYWAFKLHVWCQVLVLFISTIVFVLGWFAVGPERSLSNPHHGIGLAIYVLVVFQAMWGYLVHRIERNKKSFHVPLKLVIHRWIGRTLAILGIVQIPLGLTLYGSPKVLFILFAIAVFTYLVAFFVLSYLYDTEGYPMTSEYDSRASYVSGPSAPEEPHHNNSGRMAALGAAGAGLAQLFRRRPQNKGRQHDYDDSHTSYMDEKYSDEESRRGGGFGTKLLELGAVGAAGFFAKKLFDRRRNRDDDDTESGTYSRAHTRSDSMAEETMSRMEDGRRSEPTHRTPLYRPPSIPPSRPQSPGSSYYNSTYLSGHNDQDRPHEARNAFFGAGALGALKNLFGGRKGNDEQRRIEELRRQEMEEDRLARANSNRRRHRRDGSYTATDVTSDVTRPPHEESSVSGRPPRRNTYDGQYSDLPPVPPSHHEMPSETTGYDTSDPGAAPIPIPGRPRRSGSRQREDHAASPPVSVELKMHNDGRHVTLRRLTEEEAAANREARRRERRTSRRRNQSASSLSGNEGSNNTWRRVEEIERQQQEEIERQQAAARAAAAAAENTHSAAPSASIPPSSYAPHPSRMSGIPPPHPPPMHQRPPSTLPYGSGSFASPGPGTFTGTEASGDYANNRRRRRAERARARQERQNNVDFT